MTTQHVKYAGTLSTIYVLDKLELAVPLPKLRCILRIRDFHAVNPICAANVQLRLWLALP